MAGIKLEILGWWKRRGKGQERRGSYRGVSHTQGALHGGRWLTSQTLCKSNQWQHFQVESHCEEAGVSTHVQWTVNTGRHTNRSGQPRRAVADSWFKPSSSSCVVGVEALASSTSTSSGKLISGLNTNILRAVGCLAFVILCLLDMCPDMTVSHMIVPPPRNFLLSTGCL